MADWKEQLKRLWRKRNGKQTKQRQATTHTPWQPEESDPHGPRRQVIIGLDFGTAFTKVVIGDARTHRAVPALVPCPQSRFLQASCIGIESNGHCRLTTDSSLVDRLIPDIKLRLLDQDRDPETLAAATAFLALVLRHARDWLLQTHDKTYRGLWLDWLLNMGVPTDGYHDEQTLETFGQIASAAWAASMLPGAITLSACRSCVDQVIDGRPDLPAGLNSDDMPFLSPDKLSVIPEFTAQIAGYTRSPRRRDDLHMLVDVGAGTLDVALFNIGSHDGEDRYSIFEKEVSLLGAHKLAEHRVTRAGSNLYIDPFSPLPVRHEFCELLNIDEKTLAEIDNPFSSEVGSHLWQAINRVKRVRYPTSRRWHEEGVPIFLCGGGSRIDFYQQAARRLCETTPRSAKCHLQPMPPPHDLDAPGLDQEMTHRLSVAYGLSFDPLDLGETIKADDVPDMQLEPGRRIEDNYVDKSQS